MVSLKPFPILETTHLFLREPNLSDTQAIFRNYSDAEIAKWFFNEPYYELEPAVFEYTFNRLHLKQIQALTYRK